VDLGGKHVVVTGSSRGIGAAMARRFVAAGARVTLVARSGDLLTALADEIGARAFVADLSDPAEVDALIPAIEADVGPVDVLVNNAGLESSSWFVEEPASVTRSVIRLNLEASLVLTSAVLPGMLARGSGHLVYTSSLAGSTGFPGLATYSATKAGLNNFVAALRIELRDTPVRTTIVAPGPVDTRMWDVLEDSDDFAPMLRRLRRLQLLPKTTPDRVARRTVRAVRAGRRHVRMPHRLSLVFWLSESPRRITDLLLARVPFVRND
jgi:uncharacterized protein